MPETWDADTEIDVARARRLVAAQFPELALGRVRRLGQGWDHLAVEFDGEWVFRFPRRRLGAELLEHELVWLSVVPELPLPIPRPRYVGRAGDGYPYPFAGYRKLPGRPVSTVDAPRAIAAEPLGAFLRAVHALELRAVDPPPTPPAFARKTDPARNLAFVDERLDRLGRTRPELDHGRIRGLAAELAETVPHAGPPRWLHGDLHPAHVLCDDDGRPCAIIDWGDMHRGDPALDLSVAHGLLSPDARRTFRAAYGAIDDATWRRARFRALFYGVLLTDYGEEAGDETMLAAGLESLSNVLSG